MCAPPPLPIPITDSTLAHLWREMSFLLFPFAIIILRLRGCLLEPYLKLIRVFRGIDVVLRR